MSTLPPPQPDNLDTLMSHPAELISFPFLLQCCYDFGHWQISLGTPVEQLQDPRTFVVEADLDLFVNVVSKWPLGVPPTHRCPSLWNMVNDLRVHPGHEAFTFAQRLAWHMDRIKVWMINARIDPDNPHESKDERKRRLGREAVARHRQRYAADTGGKDPEGDLLTAALRQSADSYSQGKQWLRRRETELKDERDIAIADAKKRYADEVARARAAVTAAQSQVATAQAALDNYRINK